MIYIHLMPIDSTLQKLAEVVKTTNDKEIFISQVESLIQAFSAVKRLEVKDVQKKYPDICKVLENPDITQLVELKEHMEHMRELTVTVPGPAQKQATEVINAWRKENTEAGTITNLAATETIVGGVICSYKGQYRDFSLDKIIREKVYAAKI